MYEQIDELYDYGMQNDEAEEEEQLDEDGNPILSTEAIREVINSIPSIPFEQTNMTEE